MINKKTFKMGGISLLNKKLSAKMPIVNTGTPNEVFIQIKNANIVVKVKDKVKIGTLLATAKEDKFANIHSSVCGTITSIENKTDSSDYTLTIKTQKDEFKKSIDLSLEVNSEIELTAEEIINKIKDCGIVGMGGKGFSTAKKILSAKEKHNINTIIINGIECEPYLTSDEKLLIEKAEEIVIGARILNKTLGIQKALIAIDKNQKDAITIMDRICKRYIGVNVIICKNKYPQGSEKQLIKAITKKEVPIGKSALSIGCLVQNVATVFAIYEAVQKNKPLYERIVTVSGDAIKKPTNFLTRIGTPASFLYSQCGVLTKDVDQMIFGGPMMGESVCDINAPVDKTTSGILLLSNKTVNKCTEEDCIKCGKCADVCPMGLEPFMFSKLRNCEDTTELKKHTPSNCIECGCCSYICPAKIPLLDYVKLAKNKK